MRAHIALDQPQIVTAYATQKELDNYKTHRKENKRLSGFYRNNPDDTQRHSDKQERDNNLEDKVLFITNTNATKFIRITTRPGTALLHKLSYS
jgi:phosphosulfolactate phosphohydrolase-like enzyme